MSALPLDDYKAGFLDFAIARGALKFGEFTLKSGRVSPYFFNAGAFNTGGALASLGEYYAKAILASGVEFDLLFGPAYKGIPLVSTTAVALARDHGQDYPYVFNRKEAKTHGEGGSLVGAELTGRALIIDDVITAGTAIREVMAIIAASEARAAGVVVAIDRQEKGQGQLSAIQEVARDYAIPVVSVVTFADIVSYLETLGDHAGHLASMREYRVHYGIDS